MQMLKNEFDYQDVSDYRTCAEIIDAYLIRLEQKALDIGAVFRDFRISNNRAYKNQREKISRLGLDIRIEDNHLMIVWKKYKYNVEKDGKKEPLGKPIPRKKFRPKYLLSELKPHAQDWELDMVLQTEAELAKIRHAVFLIGKYRRKLNDVINYLIDLEVITEEKDAYYAGDNDD